MEGGREGGDVGGSWDEEGRGREGWRVKKGGERESESESESFYSVLLQTQETSAKTYLVAVAEATWKKIYT